MDDETVEMLDDLSKKKDINDHPAGAVAYTRVDKRARDDEHARDNERARDDECAREDACVTVKTWGEPRGETYLSYVISVATKTNFWF